MTNSELQRLIDNPDFSGEVHIPSGEFEGPFTISKPCRIIGNNTTIWCRKGSVITVSSSGAVLENLRIEITNENLPAAECIAVNSMHGDTKFTDVEIDGRLKGIPGEEKPWGIPKILSLGKIPAECECSFTIEVIVPVKTEIISVIHDVTISPAFLDEGKNVVTVTIAPIRSGSYIYGELLFKSAVTRRVYLSCSADEAASDFENGRVVFAADEAALEAEEKETAQVEFAEEMIFPDMSVPVSQTNEYTPEIVEDEPVETHSLFMLERGMNVPVNCESAEIELLYDNKDFPMEIDAFTFMADKHLNVTKNDRFVFFGNDHSLCGGVRYLNAPDRKVIYINFDRLPIDVAEIDIAYSIYQNPLNLNFSNLKNPAISIKLSDGRQLIYRLQPPLTHNTVVGIEIGYSESHWVINPLGMIYPMGLESLCSNYGLKIK